MTIQKATNKKNRYINALEVCEELSKLATPKIRKQKKPGSFLRKTDIIEPGVEILYDGKWTKIPDQSIVMGHTVGLINVTDPGRKYRYPYERT
jgi:hypothetical protein